MSLVSNLYNFKSIGNRRVLESSGELWIIHINTRSVQKVFQIIIHFRRLEGFRNLSHSFREKLSLNNKFQKASKTSGNLNKFHANLGNF